MTEAEALRTLAAEVATRLRDDFGLQVELAASPGEAVMLGPEGRARLTLPLQVESEGRLGFLARAVTELVLADEAPEELFPRYLPPKPDQAAAVLDLLETWIEAELGDNPRLRPVVVRRGSAVLAVNGPDYFVGLPTGDHRGDGILHLKLRRYLAFAISGVRPDDLSR